MTTGIHLLAVALVPCCKHETVSQSILTIPFHQHSFNIQISLHQSGAQKVFSEELSFKVLTNHRNTEC